MVSAVQARSRRWLTATGLRKLAILIASVSGLASCSGDQSTQQHSALNAQQSGDELRTAWYSDEPGLSPGVVSSSSPRAMRIINDMRGINRVGAAVIGAA